MEALSWGEIQSLELEQGKIQMKVREEKIAKIRPEDLADHLQSTNISNIKIFLQKLNLEKAADLRLTLVGFVSGLLQAVIYTYIGAWLLAWLHNLFCKE